MSTMKNNFPVKKGPSWIAIIIMLVIFWPVGLYLLWKRIKNDKMLALRSGNFTIGIGIFLLISAFGIMIDAFSGGGIDTIIPASFMTLIGVILIKMGQETKKRAARIRRYVGLIVNQNMTSIDELAHATNTTYNVVSDELNKLLDMGYFEGAYISKESRRLIMPRVVESTRKKANNNSQRGAKTKAVTCKSCGANIIVVEGGARKCEYCGSPVQG